jgi:hypothetical protein
VFADDEVTVHVPFHVAWLRLNHLITRSALDSPSEAAYEGGLGADVRVGPFGSMRGASKLVRVRLLGPVHRGDATSIGLRWEATGAAGELLPVLDADLTLSRDGADRSRLRLAGSYRPPFGRAGAALDRAVLHRVATATIRSLLEAVADRITDPAPEQEHAPGTAQT